MQAQDAEGSDHSDFMRNASPSTSSVSSMEALALTSFATHGKSEAGYPHLPRSSQNPAVLQAWLVANTDALHHLLAG